MSKESLTKRPKPFVFVLMPFDKEFDDIYKFGIKGAAEDVGAYAERLDEQVFKEGMLDRIFNQISKADVVIADMTGRNPNVFYEVGYAHALGKIVLLITQGAKDIPFDLKHRQHTVYEGRIEQLRKDLATKLPWAINESRLSGGATPERISVRLHSTELVADANIKKPAVIDAAVTNRQFAISLSVRNDSPDAIIGLSHIYLFIHSKSFLIPSEQAHIWPSLAYSNVINYVPPATYTTNYYTPIEARDEDSTDGLTQQYRLPISIERFPPSAIEQRYIGFEMNTSVTKCDELMRLRLHSEHQFWDYRFRIILELQPEEKQE